jgi:4-amino-4-deoxy-L-arabinose transferase-like glycosyltransferase
LDSSRYKNGALLLLILLIALGMRLWHYTGPIGSDDTWYYLGAHEIYEGTYEPGDNYWKTRYGMLVPIAVSYGIFGTNELAAALWPMLCSLGAVALCYFLGKMLLDASAGLLAATLLAFYPLDIHYSGLILPDVPLSFLMAASVAAFIYAGKAEKYSWVMYLLSGAFLAVAYSCRSMAVILLPFYGIYVLCFEKKIKPVHFLFGVGFLAVFSAECLYFAIKGLGPLHNFTLNAQAAIAVNSSGECSTSQSYYPSVIFSRTNMTVFGTYFLLFIPSMIVAAVRRERGGLIFLLWAALLLGILQFGFVSLFPPIPMLKVRKFLNFATVPLIMTSAYALMQVRVRYRVAVVITMAGLSIFLMRGFRYSDNMTPEAWGGNVREVAAHLESLPPKIIYADGRTSGMIQLATGFDIDADRFIDLYDVTTIDELEDCYIVINKFYASFDQGNPFASVPKFVASYPRGIPPSWQIKEFWQSDVIVVP